MDFAQRCGWVAGPHLAGMMRENRFRDWERVFAAVDDTGAVRGFCTVLREDYYPENRYWPWISSIFVEEIARGRRISHRLIDAACAYLKAQGFDRAYIPTDMSGFYEKCGFLPIDTLCNYGGDVDTIYAKDLT